MLMLTDKPSELVLTEKTRALLWWLFGFLLIARIVCSAVIPLTDTSEARYAELARKMLETGDWITPQHYYGVPFWAKPPLSTWLSAFSMKLFGVNEFAVRLPSLLLAIAVLALVWKWMVERRGRDAALLTTAILAGSALFFIAGGAVMTDPSLALCTTLTMISFWQAVHFPHHLGGQRYWGYLFFVALGIGLLAKGLAIGLLTFLPIILWVVLRKNWSLVWRALPWIKGTLLMLAISMPWYLIAEQKTPGFLAYFILGEHFSRFLQPSWSGDRYGHAHSEQYGMIWVFWLMSTAPWSLLFLAKAKTLFTRRAEWLNDDTGWMAYLLLWAFMPMVFFTFAPNIIWPYALPALPAFAILFAEVLQRFDAAEKPLSPRLPLLNLVMPLGLLGLAALYVGGSHTLIKPSQKPTADLYLAARTSPDNGLYYFRRRYYSGEFYTAGKAAVIQKDGVPALLNNGVMDFLVIQEDDLKSRIEPEVRAHFEPLQQFGEFIVMRELPTKL